MQHLELVTVTDDSFILTWYTADAPPPAIPFDLAAEPAPVATDGLVRYGTDPSRLDRMAVQRGGATAYHYVEVTGLRPGVTYYYQAGHAQRRHRRCPVRVPAGCPGQPPAPADPGLRPPSRDGHVGEHDHCRAVVRPGPGGRRPAGGALRENARRVLHHSGHTHRNLRTSSPAAPAVEFLEVAATKEYPGGFARLRIYAGGYMVSFFKSSSALARQWSQTSSGVPGPVPGLHARHQR